MGDPVGHWEAAPRSSSRITNLNGQGVATSMVGGFYTEKARIVERFTFVDQQTLKYTATFEDPTVYTRPWTLGIDLKRIPDDEDAGNSRATRANAATSTSCGRPMKAATERRGRKHGAGLASGVHAIAGGPSGGTTMTRFVARPWQ